VFFSLSSITDCTSDIYFGLGGANSYPQLLHLVAVVGNRKKHLGQSLTGATPSFFFLTSHALQTYYSYDHLYTFFLLELFISKNVHPPCQPQHPTFLVEDICELQPF
jgi:hypothetical protein